MYFQCAQYKWKIFLPPKHTHYTLCFNQHQSAVTFPQHSTGTVLCFKNLPLKQYTSTICDHNSSTEMYLYCLLLSETFAVMHWNIGNCTIKRTIIYKFYTAELMLLYFVTIGQLEKISRSSRHIISVFHNLAKAVPLATVWTQHLRTVRHKSSQLSAI